MLTYKVLLVDDEEEVMDTIEHRISWNEMGFEVIGKARNGVKALEISERFGYIQPIACYGSAVLPLLTKVEPSVSDDHEIQDAFIKRVIDSVRKQAVNYPDFLRPQPQMKEQLSPAEKQVLKLICSNRSNQEIADILGVKLATVKTHVVHILQKLGVKRRSEAKEMAERLHMV